MRQNPQRQWLDTLIQALRPLWWVVRGLAIYWLAAAVFGAMEPGLIDLIAALGLIAVSVMWGRKQFGQQRWARRVGLAISAITASVVLATIWWGADSGVLMPWAGPQQAATVEYPGAYIDAYYDGGGAPISGTGMPIQNLYVYGPDGAPVPDARIVDGMGNPVVLSDAATGLPWDQWSPELDFYLGGDVPQSVLTNDHWNVYPWSFIPESQLAQRPDGSLVGTGSLAPQWPFDSLPPLPSEQ